jgi:transcriptional regulator with XRE-family HTH domain
VEREPEPFAVQVGRAIAAARRASDLTQEELAERLGIAVRNVQKIEAGQNVSVNKLARIAAALRVAIVDLVAVDGTAFARRAKRLANPVKMRRKSTGKRLRRATARQPDAMLGGRRRVACADPTLFKMPSVRGARYARRLGRAKSSIAPPTFGIRFSSSSTPCKISRFDGVSSAHSTASER